MSEQRYETCIHCGSRTGKAGAGEDSIYLGTIGPFCEDCYDETGFYNLESQIDAMRDFMALLYLGIREGRDEAFEALDDKTKHLINEVWFERLEEDGDGS